MSLQILQQQSEFCHTFNEWLESIHRSNRTRPANDEGMSRTPILQQFEEVAIENPVEIVNNDRNGNDKSDHKIVQIGLTDIQDQMFLEFFYCIE